MRSRFPSSIGLGRWGRVVVRLHVYFVAFAAATLYLCWPADSTGAAGVSPLWTATGDMRGIAAAALAVLFCSVWWHELAHWWVARCYGLQPDLVVLGPLGGLTPWGSAERAGVELSIWSAGPAANLAVVLACRGWLGLRGGTDTLNVASWNPFQPECFGVEEGGLVQGVQLVVWVNWLLFLLNILPAYPFDGGHIFRAVIRRLRPAWDSPRLDRSVDATAVVVAGMLLVTALELWRRQGADVLFPSWLPLLLLGVLMLVGVCHQTGATPETSPVDVASRSRVRASRRRESSRGPRPMPHCRPANAPRETPAADAEQEGDRDLLPSALDIDDERQIDAILSRVHALGMHSLSAQERVLLERASARYRSRLGKRT